jgi:AraC family transcriptional regulator
MDVAPQIVTLPSQTFAGVQARFISAASPEANHLQIIPRLWATFSARVHELRSTEPGVFYGLCDGGVALGEMITRPDELFYLAAVPIDPGARVPPGMRIWEAPGGTYAKFVHRGPVETIGRTMDHIYATWLPQSGYASGAGPDLERYTADFDPASEDSTLEIYIPVRRIPTRRTR